MKSKIESLPLTWHVLLTAVVAGGLVLIIVNPAVPSWVETVSSRVRPDAWSKLIGVLMISTAFTHWIVFAVLALTWRLFELSGGAPRRNLWPPALVGLCESIMYPVALVIGQPEFIGLWLLLKVAGQWPRWGLQASSGPGEVETLDEGRRRYQRFLIGNALMVIAGVGTYAMMKVLVLR